MPDEIPNTDPVSSQQAEIPPGVSVQETQPRRRLWQYLTLPIGITGILIIFLTAFAMSGLLRVKSDPEQTAGSSPTPDLQIPTTAPTRDLHPLATSSAFLSFEASLASFSAHLSGFTVESDTVYPPVLEMKLGFQSE